ncbi:UNVERIFIED_CONTAM: hypothetical protein K2H54_036491, partial [Gekko kuhli]
AVQIASTVEQLGVTLTVEEGKVWMAVTMPLKQDPGKLEQLLGAPNRQMAAG